MESKSIPERPVMDFRLNTAIVYIVKFELIFRKALSFRIKNSSKCLIFLTVNHRRMMKDQGKILIIFGMH